MLDVFSIHNAHWQAPETFEKTDPHLRELIGIPYAAPLDWWRDLLHAEGGLFILSGGRQIGKSTSLKLLISELLKEPRWQDSPRHIFYLPCDQIDDRRELYQLATTFLEGVGDDPFFLLVDEITFVAAWEKTLKGLADEGRFRHGVCIITGSDRLMLDEAATALPGRRGGHARVDFNLTALTFRHYVALTNPALLEERDPLDAQPPEAIQDAPYRDAAQRAFSDYLVCGGFLKPLNELHSLGAVRDATYRIYQNWVVGDFLKRGKRREFLTDVLGAIIDTLGSQVTYGGLSRRCMVSKDTLIDYVNLLVRMNVILLQKAFDQNKLAAHPKKAQKIAFRDPFITEAMRRMVRPQKTIPESIVVENLVVAHHARACPVFYIKAEGEVDLVVLEDTSFRPIEVKWTTQTRPKDLKQIQKYPNGRILTRSMSPGILAGIPTTPLVMALLSL